MIKTRLKLILALLVIAALSIPAFGQQTVEEWIEEGNALSIQGNYTEAIMAFDKAIRLDPEDAVVWNNKGFSLGIQGKYEEAIQAFDEAIRLDPELTEARYNKGKVVEGLDWTSEANTA